jgi:hypothetical protein
MTESFAGPGTPISARDFEACCAKLDVGAPALWAVLAVESRGFGFFVDKRPQILFERHKFRKRTGGRFDARFPAVSGPRGGYLKGAAEYGRLATAMRLDRDAALKSASWGLGQVMGFNFKSAGFGGVDQMVQAFVEGESAQLMGVVNFILDQSAMAQALRRQDWAKFAFFYNGPLFRDNKYDSELERNHALYEAGHAPDIGLRTVQARLAYLGFDPNGVDGQMGPGTRAAIVQFQKKNGLSVTGEADGATADALAHALPFPE